VNKVAKRGSIKDDQFFKKCLKDMLIKLADESRGELHDLLASISSQIPHPKELILVDASYYPTVLPNLCALAKSNVETSYTHSGQVGDCGKEG
jgi:hypothetical protein